MVRPEDVVVGGFVYFIEANIAGMYKIGITYTLERRMKELQPREIIEVVRVANPRSLEVELHAALKEFRLAGTEYFTLDESQVDAVRARMNPREPEDSEDIGISLALKYEKAVEDADIAGKTYANEKSSGSPARAAILEKKLYSVRRQSENVREEIEAHAWATEGQRCLELVSEFLDRRYEDNKDGATEPLWAHHLLNVLRLRRDLHLSGLSENEIEVKLEERRRQLYIEELLIAQAELWELDGAFSTQCKWSLIDKVVYDMRYSHLHDLSPLERYNVNMLFLEDPLCRLELSTRIRVIGIDRFADIREYLSSSQAIWEINERFGEEIIPISFHQLIADGANNDATISSMPPAGGMQARSSKALLLEEGLSTGVAVVSTTQDSLTRKNKKKSLPSNSYAWLIVISLFIGLPVVMGVFVLLTKASDPLPFLRSPNGSNGTIQN